MKLTCTGGDGKSCSRAPKFATWCECPSGDGGTLGSVFFLFCAECLALDLERDPGDRVFALEDCAPSFIGLHATRRPR